MGNEAAVRSLQNEVESLQSQVEQLQRAVSVLSAENRALWYVLGEDMEEDALADIRKGLNEEPLSSIEAGVPPAYRSNDHSLGSGKMGTGESDGTSKESARPRGDNDFQL